MKVLCLFFHANINKLGYSKLLAALNILLISKRKDKSLKNDIEEDVLLAFSCDNEMMRTLATS
jgi:hypothetical protein